jgi:acyl-CoA thioester hydrolase
MPGSGQFERRKEAQVYEKMLMAGWGDMDFNSHMRNTAYLDKAGDVRMLYFSENGFPMQQFAALRIGPVIMKDELEYFREVGLLETLRVTLGLAALSEDGARFSMRNEFFRADGNLAARITSDGGWLDLAARKLVAPPEKLLAALRSLPRTEDSRGERGKV